MRELNKYAFANAKIRAMLSCLIAPDQFFRLLEAADIYEIKDELKKTAYGALMENISRQSR